MLYSVRDLLLHLKNPQTKLKFFSYLEIYDSLDSSVGLFYQSGRLIKKNIY